ncbi:hypothetical protein [Mycolicibacterium brumae]|uniref:Uncharacterized protein n=1 Tax=Mycolicibacterium brumae TaxID=85968 RepID=A0A2G5PF79_9MYCO|nr:hypothetical protein [Mycolicibacterium brumae]MCV7192079.1 hypothetical protein [Mycolicibacterium brumae]PIB76962.1 hypothetical protein CQY22_003465 [Mycolicibacterium brumae]UWW07843.1 hypothetical protein L2Z93_000877 [Mycolicibacterium brumae]
MTERKCLIGLELRYMLAHTLSQSGVLTVAELTDLLAADGFTVAGRPSKTIPDALRWEVRRGRVIRRGRGLYGPGDIPRSTEHRIKTRVAKLKEEAGAASSSWAGGRSGPWNSEWDYAD